MQIMLALLLASASVLAQGVDRGASAVRPNFLVILLDDVGVDKVGGYGEHPNAGPTPIIDFVMSQGMSFRNAWVQPVCSPTRASMLTGRYPYHHGVGASPNKGGPTISNAETTIAEALTPLGYRTGLVGKWHLAGTDVADPFMHPIDFGGFEVSAGTRANIPDYFAWVRSVADASGSSQELVNTYATTQQVDDALAMIDGWGAEPWFLWLAFNAPHKPFHVPPAHLHTQGPLVSASKPAIYRAMLEAADTEIGRLLTSIRPAVLNDTYVFIIGDNGTYAAANTPPFGGDGNNKGDVKEGGVNVPFVVWGPDVRHGMSNALISSVDVLPTLVELAGARPPTLRTIDGVSIARLLRAPPSGSARTVVYSETHQPNGLGPYQNLERTVRDTRYKLIRRSGFVSSGDENVAFYDLFVDPFETDNLYVAGGVGDPLQKAAFDALDAALSAHQ